MQHLEKNYSNIISVLTQAQNVRYEVIQKFTSKSENFGIELGIAEQLCITTPIGDINKDGNMDLLVASSGGEKMYFLFLDDDASVKEFKEFDDWTLALDSVPINNFTFGYAMDTIGDLNGDGITDIVVGNPHAYGGIGHFIIFLLDQNGGVISQVEHRTDYDHEFFPYGSGIGSCFAAPGDLNNDGVPDLLMGAAGYYSHDTVPENNLVHNFEGAIYALYLNTDGSIKDTAVIHPTINKFSQFMMPEWGKSFALVDDLDGNGFKDLVVSTSGMEFWVVLMKESFQILSTQKVGLDHAAVDSMYFFTQEISDFIDVDGDGRREVLFATNPILTDARGYIGYLTDDGDISKLESMVENIEGFEAESGSKFGLNSSYLGDINGDGYPEIAIGDPYNSEVDSNAGAIYILTAKPQRCEPRDCVWPGDANNDGVVNSRDITSIGGGFNKSSLSNKRILAVTTWNEQTCSNWGDDYNGVNLKHADCNGDGVINFDDIPTVNSNYSLSISKMDELIEVDPNGPPLLIKPLKDTVYSSDSIDFGIYLGSEDILAEDVYGVSMTLKHDVSEVFGGNNSATFAGSWLGTKDVDMITLSVSLNDGIDIGLARIDQQNRTGQGYLSTVRVIIPDNLTEIQRNLNLYLTDLLIVSYEGDTILPNVIATDTVVVLNSNNVNQSLFDSKVQIFPNPTTGVLNYRSSIDVDEICIRDLYGRKVFRKVNPNFHELIDLKKLPKGIYFYSVYVNNKHETIKVVLK